MGQKMSGACSSDFRGRVLDAVDGGSSARHPRVLWGTPFIWRLLSPDFRARKISEPIARSAGDIRAEAGHPRQFHLVAAVVPLAHVKICKEQPEVDTQRLIF